MRLIDPPTADTPHVVFLTDESLPDQSASVMDQNLPQAAADLRRLLLIDVLAWEN